MTAARTLLVYRTGQLGDTLVSVPAVRAIRAAYADRELVLLTDQHPGRGLVSSWDVFEATGLFSRVIFYTPAADPTGWPRFVEVARQVRQLRAEAMFYLRDPHWRYVWRDRWFFKVVCGIRHIYGADEIGLPFGERDAAGQLWRLPSETDRLLALVAAAGVPVPRREAVRFELPIGSAEQAAVDRFWQQAGIPHDAPVVAIGPGSKMAAKQWPLDRFQELGRRLLAAFPACWLFIVGGSEDEPLAQALMGAIRSRVVSAAGRLSVLESAEALRRCRLYVGNDTGAMHLAAAMGTRCVAIFSARDHPGRWDPYGSGHVVLRRDPPCAGCLLQTCLERRMVCLTDITLDEVFEAVYRMPIHG